MVGYFCINEELKGNAHGARHQICQEVSGKPYLLCITSTPSQPSGGGLTA
jgi:hypothetical protein